MGKKCEKYIKKLSGMNRPESPHSTAGNWEKLIIFEIGNHFALPPQFRVCKNELIYN